MIPMSPATIEITLTIPPRVPGKSATKNPITPSTIARIAKVAPPNAPERKLMTAQITARIEGMLKAGRDLGGVVSMHAG